MRRKKSELHAQSIEPQLNLVFGATFWALEKAPAAKLFYLINDIKKKVHWFTFFLSNEKQNKTNQTHKKEANKKSNKHKSLFRVARERALYLVMTMMMKRHARAVHERRRESQGHTLVGSRMAHFACCSKWRASSQAISRVTTTINPSIQVYSN